MYWSGSITCLVVAVPCFGAPGDVQWNSLIGFLLIFYG